MAFQVVAFHGNAPRKLCKRFDVVYVGGPDDFFNVDLELMFCHIVVRHLESAHVGPERRCREMSLFRFIEHEMHKSQATKTLEQRTCPPSAGLTSLRHFSGVCVP